MDGTDRPLTHGHKLGSYQHVNNRHNFASFLDFFKKAHFQADFEKSRMTQDDVKIDLDVIFKVVMLAFVLFVALKMTREYFCQKTDTEEEETFNRDAQKNHKKLQEVHCVDHKSHSKYNPIRVDASVKGGEKERSLNEKNGHVTLGQTRSSDTSKPQHSHQKVQKKWSGLYERQFPFASEFHKPQPSEQIQRRENESPRAPSIASANSPSVPTLVSQSKALQEKMSLYVQKSKKK